MMPCNVSLMGTVSQLQQSALLRLPFVVLPKLRQDSACVVIFCSLAALSLSPHPNIRSRSALARPLPCNRRVPPASRSNLEFLSSFLPFSFLCTCKNSDSSFVGTVNSSYVGWWTGWEELSLRELFSWICQEFIVSTNTEEYTIVYSSIAIFTLTPESPVG